MKIGVDIRPLQQKYYSGVSEYTYQLLKHLLEIDKKNQYLLFYNSHKNTEKHIPNFDYPNVEFKKFNLPNKLLNISLTFLSYPKLDQLLGGVDIFFCPNLNFSAFSKKVKTVLTIHDLTFIRHPEFFDLKHKLWHLLINPKKLIKQANHIISVSKNTKRDLLELCEVPTAKTTVTLLGLDPALKEIDKKNPALQKIKEKYNLPNKFILYLGTIEPRKNINSIIESLDNVNSSVHLVIGGKKGWKYKQVLKTAQKYSNRVHFLNYVDPKDKIYLYNLAEVFVWPSFYEGFGLPPLEAQACGTPIVVGCNSSMVEVVGQSGILVNPDNVNEISIAINEFLKDSQLRNYFKNLGFQNAQKFNWQQTAKKTLDTFNQLINS